MMRKLSHNKTPTLAPPSPSCFGSTHPGRMQKQTNKKQNKRREMIHTTTKKGKQTTDANTKRERTKLCQLTEKEKRTTESRKSIDEKMRKKN